MKIIPHILALLIGLAALRSLAAEDQSILNPSGLPIPRFVSLKSDEINVRVGPGKRYPIRWTYRRKLLPVQIIEEFAHWRKIQDYEGATGWVQKSFVDGKRTVIIIDKPQTLYREADATSKPVMRVDPLVIGHLKQCKPDWCEVEIQEKKAWIRKSDIWGVTREEVFDK
jgi:SH3-like domain-containing protein